MSPTDGLPRGSADIQHGECLDVMRGLTGFSVDAIVTDPPYALTANKKGGSGEASVNLESPYGRARIGTGNGGGGFMGKAWDAALPRVEVWAEALRVAKPGAHLVAFGGTRTYHRLACAIEDAGWEIRDCLSWLYGSGFPKSHNGAWGGTALKPAWEPIMLARKPLIGTVAANVAAHYTGALNISACRIGTSKEVPASSSDSPNGVYGQSSPRKADRIGMDPEVGRWPANVVLDEEAAALLDVQSGELTSGTAVGGLHRRSNKTANCYGRFVGERTEGDVCFGDSGGASRFFYTAKASRSEREAGLSGCTRHPLNWSSGEQSPGTFQSPNTDRTSSNSHPTVKPLALMRWLCRLVAPRGGLILDPFMGSGTTGCAAVLEGFGFLGIEREAEYVQIASRRIAYWREQYQPALDLGGVA